MSRDMQMNVRIDSSLKYRGDAVLAKAGYSPSAAVRAVWQFAADNERNPAYVGNVLKFKPEHSGTETASREVHPSQLIEQFLSKRLAGTGTSLIKELSYKELRDEYYDSLIEERQAT
ncbi:MAG: hypothetical protein IKE43_03830 [Coriobacteriales bacterium]|nr:hypothetical protein [Coriobacteriales bacterium]